MTQPAGMTLTSGATYAWAAADPETSAKADPRVANELFQSRLQSAIETALRAKGYRRADDPKTAQLLIAYHVGLTTRTVARSQPASASTLGSCGPLGCTATWGIYGAPVMEVHNVSYTEGALILDLVDSASGKLAWRAVSKKRIDRREATQESLDAILADTTRSLPGGPG